jgi:signal transduction histidine kinase
VIDITERKRAEKEREALIRDLEQKNNELERFTYTISHDLKTPLITILGFAGLLEESIARGDVAEVKQTIARISGAALRMEELLADVLQLSRVGRIVAPPQPASFSAIAREAADLVAGPLGQRGVQVEITPDMPVVYVDRNRIREVMVNLIENAVKYLGNQPEPRIWIGVTWEDGTPVFFVRDNGIGIPPAYLGRIFDLFEKLDPKSPGSGVGLTIVKRIIEIHGGTIRAESEGEGRGTGFYFTLPQYCPPCGVGHGRDGTGGG